MDFSKAFYKCGVELCDEKFGILGSENSLLLFLRNLWQQ